MDPLFPMSPYAKLQRVYQMYQNGAPTQQGAQSPIAAPPAAPAQMAPPSPTVAPGRAETAAPDAPYPPALTRPSGPENAIKRGPSLLGQVHPPLLPPMPAAPAAPLLPQEGQLGAPQNIVPEGYAAGAQTAVQQAMGAGDILAGLKAPAAPEAQRVSTPGLPNLRGGAPATDLVAFLLQGMSGQKPPVLPELNRMLR